MTLWCFGCLEVFVHHVTVCLTNEWADAQDTGPFPISREGRCTRHWANFNFSRGLIWKAWAQMQGHFRSLSSLLRLFKCFMDTPQKFLPALRVEFEAQ